MSKLQFLFLVALIIQTTIAEDCLNPLLNTFNFVGTPTPIIDINLKYCKSLRAGKTCCTADTIDTFQSKIEQFMDRLRILSIDRDRYLLTAKKDYVPRYQETAVAFARAAYDAIPKLKQQNYPEIIKISLMANIGKAMRDSIESLEADFSLYQKARSACFSELSLIKAASWCLACDPNYADKGVYGIGSIDPSENLCKRISIAQPTIMPLGCESKDNCQWACSVLFAGGDIQEAILANGGGETGNALTISYGDKELDEKQKKLLARQIQSGYKPSWNPDSNEAEVKIVIEDNPANLSGYKVIVSSTSVILVLLSLLAI